MKNIVIFKIISTDSVATCFEISNQLSIQIAFAYVGNEYNKQAKIVKVVYNWNNTINFRFDVKLT